MTCKFSDGDDIEEAKELVIYLLFSYGFVEGHQTPHIDPQTSRAAS